MCYARRPSTNVCPGNRVRYTPDTIEVAQGSRVRLTIRSLDVNHGFAIAAFGVDSEIPAGGESVVVEFLADRSGVFPFTYSVFCGLGHGNMAGTLTVQPREGGLSEASGGATEPVDYTLVSLPTTLEVPRHRTAFRVAHRFARSLGEGSFGSLAEDLFGLDSSALVGLEFRFSPIRRGQIGIYRTSNRTIELFGQYSVIREQSHGLGVDLRLGIEGTNNFRDDRSPIVGAVISRSIGSRLSVYAQPMWVGNTKNAGLLHPTLAGLQSSDDHTVMVGLGGRLRVRPTVYLVAEVAPRIAGLHNANPHASFAIEKRVGGHGFQLNVSNGLGSTIGQIAQGGSEDGWFLGFNITRRFF